MRVKREQPRQLLPHCASLRAPTLSSCGRTISFTSWIRHVHFPRPYGGHSKAEYAMCVASDPMWVITTAFTSSGTPGASLLPTCGPRKLNMPMRHVRRLKLCIIHFDQPLHLARTRGGREMASTLGLRCWPRRTGQTALDRAHSQHRGPSPPQEKKMSHTHTPSLHRTRCTVR